MKHFRIRTLVRKVKCPVRNRKYGKKKKIYENKKLKKNSKTRKSKEMNLERY
jgi:hypothetical protein